MSHIGSTLLPAPVAAAAAAIALSAIGAAAHADPKFEYSNPEKAGVEKVNGVEWKVGAQAGLIITTGNSRATTMAAGVTASRKQGNNKLAVEAGGAFARSSILLGSDDNGNGTLEENELSRLTDTTTQAWYSKARYDRFLTKHNSLYVAALLSGDEPAGKELVAGGQVGYSRQLYKTKAHEVVGEVGYDFSFEDLTVGDPLSIHSARLFAGYKGSLTKDTGLEGSLEFLANLNSLDTPTGEAKAFRDRRSTFLTALTTKLFSNISFRFAFSLKHDSVPAPLPALSIPYAPGFVPPAEELDTKTEASLIVNFL